MKMRYTAYILLSAFVLASCVRDEIEPCPPLRVDIAVKDKNYFNVDKVAELEERLDDNLAFRAYVPTLHYTLRDAATGEVVEERGVFEVTGEGKTYPVDFGDDLPHGTYVLTVWGGLKDLDPLSDDRTTISFHPENTEGRDIYLVNDTLVYGAWNYDYTAELERTKGKLIIQAMNLPSDVTYSDKTVTALYGRMNHAFEYSERTSVHTRADWQGTEVVTKTVLSPSVRKKASVLSVNFYDSPRREQPVFSPDNVDITMERNVLTVLRYVYDGSGRFTVYILVNDNWEKVHGMVVD